MTEQPADTILGYLRTFLRPKDVQNCTDAQLLNRYLTARDQEAFATLMERHGRLVWNICQHLLGHQQDAEDAFQATFLVLARKATSIRRSDTVAGWLYGVASRVARKARQAAARRRKRERQAPGAQEESASEIAVRELQALLDQAVNGLPRKYRIPFILCCLEGKRRSEVARELGWNEGTLSTRIAEARRRLRASLARHGVTLPAALMALASVESPVSAALQSSTMQGIAAYLTGTPARAFSVPVVGLAQQAVNGMMIPRFLLGTFVILGLVAAGAGTAIWATPGAEPGRASIESGTGTATHPLSGEERKPVRYQHEGNAETVAFSADGKLVAAQSNRQTVFVWDAATGTLLHRLLLAELSKGEVFGTVPAIDFSPDGKSVVLRRYDGTHWLWELTSGKELVHTPPFIKGTPPGVIGRVRFSPDGNMIASLGGGHTRLLSTKTGEELLRIKGLPYSAAFSPDSRRIALGSSIANIPIRICDTTTGAELSTFNGGFEVRSIAFTADGKIVAGGSLGMVVLIEAATGKEIVRLKAAMKLAYALAFTPDGKTLVSADQGNQVRIWDLASQKERFVLDVIAGTQPPTRPLPGRSLVLSPDGKTLIVSSAADTLHVWDVRTGRKLSP